MPIVINVNNHEEYVPHVYVGRPSFWGNPFHVGEHGRSACLRAYENHFVQKLIHRLSELRGMNLGCHCAPKECHADMLLRLANVSLFFLLFYFYLFSFSNKHPSLSDMSSVFFDCYTFP